MGTPSESHRQGVPHRSGWERAEPYLLGWGLAFCGAAGVHAALDWLTPATPFGPLALAGAVITAAVVGSVSAAGLGRHFEAADLPNGGRVLAVCCVMLATALLLAHPTPLPGPYLEALAGALRDRLIFAPVVLAATLPTILPRLALGENEALTDGRFRRALGYWLAVATPPAAALVLLRPTGASIVYWPLLLIVPLAPLLGGLGVRIAEERLHHRQTRWTLALVSALATLFALALGTARELAA